MFSTMSIVDIIQSIGVVATIIFSVIGIMQAEKAGKKASVSDSIANESNAIANKSNAIANESNAIANESNAIANKSNAIADESNTIAREAAEVATKANEIATKANEIAQKALNDSQKDYMPLVKLVDEIKCDSKSIEELCKEITFDFYKGLACNDYSEICFNEDDEYIPIGLKIKNIGKGIIRKMKIESLLICYGNKTVFDKLLDDDFEIEIIFYEPDVSCEQEFILCENDDINVNFLLPKEEYRINTDKLNEKVRNEDILIMMELEIFSTNESSYCQKSLWCNFEKGVAGLCSFDDVVSSSYERFSEKQS